jgi:hypothetical protein
MARKPKEQEKTGNDALANDQKAGELCAWFESQKSNRDARTLNDWRDIASYAQPRQGPLMTEGTMTTASNWAANIFSGVLAHANNVLAAGIFNLTTPLNDRWFGYEAPESGDESSNDTATRWYQKCGEKAQKALSKSNFYTAIQESHLDRNLYGTTAINIQQGARKPVSFKTWEPGSYVFSFNDDGELETAGREFKLPVRALDRKWPDAVWGGKVKAKIDSPKESDRDEEFTVLHVLRRRPDREVDQAKALDPMSMPIASCYVLKEDKTLIEEGGFTSMPVAVGRFYTWAGTDWGWGPGSDALPTIRQLNFLEEKMDVLAEKKADPPMLLPSYLAGQADARAHGVTHVDENQEQFKPETWGNEGEYNVGLDRIERKEEFVRKVFFNDIFQMFGSLEREITAYQAMQLANEKLDNFCPAFKRFVDEILNPLLERLFQVLYDIGTFGQPPPEVLKISDDGTNTPYVPAPKVVYQSKMALAIQAIENRSIVDLMNLLGPIMQMRPDTMDNFDMDKIAVDVARNSGTKADWITRPRDRDGMRQERAKQQQAMMQAEMAQGMARAGKDASQIQPEKLRGLMS